MNKFEVRGMDLYYGSFHALKNININIPEKEITAFIGPSGWKPSTRWSRALRITATTWSSFWRATRRRCSCF